MSERLIVRQDTAANWTAANPTLAAGEWALETDTDKLKMGDGSTAWVSLGYQAELPTSSLDNALPRFHGATGRILQDSSIIIDDSDNVTGVGTLASGALTVTGSVTASTSVQAAAASGFIVGASGPQILSGTGSPEGVVSAPVGSTWTQTDSTVGVTRWVKPVGTAGNTGWIVDIGDTGLRQLGGVLANTWTATNVTLQRAGALVIVCGYVVVGTNATSTTIYTLPVGFRPPTLAAFPTWPGGAGAPTQQATVTPGGAIVLSGTSATYSAGRFLCSFNTMDAWPTALPGA